MPRTKPLRDYKETNSSTRHVLEAMRLICQSEEPVDLTTLATRMSLPASTAHRALLTLEQSGFIKRASISGARFVAGDVVHHLIRSLVAQFPLRKLLIGRMRELSEKYDVTVSLNQRIGGNSIRLTSVEGSRESYQLRRVGELRPLHSGIGPRAILVALPRKDFDAYLDFASSELGQNASTDLDALRVLRHSFETKGYILRESSPQSPLFWMSVPLVDAEGLPIASVSMGSIDELPGDLEPEFLKGVGDMQEAVRLHPDEAHSPITAIP